MSSTGGVTGCECGQHKGLIIHTLLTYKNVFLLLLWSTVVEILRSNSAKSRTIPSNDFVTLFATLYLIQLADDRYTADYYQTRIAETITRIVDDISCTFGWQNTAS